MKRLLKIKSLKFGEDIQVRLAPNMLELVLTSKKHKKHDGVWKATEESREKYDLKSKNPIRYDNPNNDEMVIGVIKYCLVEKEKFGCIYVEYIEVQPEYRGLYTFLPFIESFYEKIMYPLVSKYGKDGCFVFGFYANEKLKRYVLNNMEEKTGCYSIGAYIENVFLRKFEEAVQLGSNIDYIQSFANAICELEEKSEDLLNIFTIMKITSLERGIVEILKRNNNIHENIQKLMQENNPFWSIIQKSLSIAKQSFSYIKRLMKKSNINRTQFNDGQLYVIDQAVKKQMNFDVFQNPETPSYIMQSILTSLEVIQSKYYDIQYVLDNIKAYCKTNEELEEKLRTFAKIIVMGKHFDSHRRNYAILYGNNQFYVGETHNDCLAQFARKNKRKQLEFEWVRPDDDERQQILNKNDVIFMGHVIDNIKTVEVYPYVKDEKAIYLINESIWLQNITLQEAAKKIKESKQYQSYEVYIDDHWTINFQTLLKEYPKP